MIELSPRDARRIALHRQGLLRAASFGRGKAATRHAIERIGYVQIDTISVVDRAHHHILKSRIPNFSPAMLDQLQREDRSVFEYWFHAAAYLPMTDFRFYLPVMKGYARTREVDRRHEREILARIRSDGPARSRDFAGPPGYRSAGWWNWKPAKQALEHMFLSGTLMVSHREGFEKVFDLPGNVLPADLDTRVPRRREWCRELARRVLQSTGIGCEADLAYPLATMQRFIGEPLRADFSRGLQELVENGDALAVSVAGERYYVPSGAPEALPRTLGRRRIIFLSPFDNLVINRRRLAALFGFDYQIECYVPKAKRKYGYFSLPMLYGDQLVGRVDAKAERKQQRLVVRGLFLEPWVKPDRHLPEALRKALTAFCASNGCSHWEVQRSDPALRL